MIQYKLVPGQNKCILSLYPKHMVQILMWTNTELDFFDQFANMCLKLIISMNFATKDIHCDKGDEVDPSSPFMASGFPYAADWEPL